MKECVAAKGGKGKDIGVGGGVFERYDRRGCISLSPFCVCSVAILTSKSLREFLITEMIKM